MVLHDHTCVFAVGDMSIGRQEAFEIFRRDYEHNDAIEDNTRELKSRYAEAKSLGAVVNKSKNAISKFKFIFLSPGLFVDLILDFNCQSLFEPHREKTAFCICENKDADQLRGKLISAFVFAT